MKHDFFARERVSQRRKIDIGQRIDNDVMPRRADLEQTEFFPITVKTVGFGINRDAIDRFKLWKQLAKLRGVRDHFSPPRSSSALVFVLFRLSINFSIASIGGIAAIAFRKSCTRSHSSG